MRYVASSPFIFLKKLGYSTGRTQDYLKLILGLTQSMIQMPRMCWGCNQPTGKHPEHHVCAGVCPALRQEPKRHVCAWSTNTQAGNSSVMCTPGLPRTHAFAQMPRVTTWFFFNSNNNFLKFINDDNNNNNF